MFRNYDPEELVSVFNKKFNHPNVDITNVALWYFLVTSIKKECYELNDAVIRFSAAQTEKEKIKYLNTMIESLGELLYTIYGTTITFNIPIYDILEAIHKRNIMTQY